MKWRCPWCGKPHESNDPPCDSCGHPELEEAVVREAEPEFETVDTGTQYLWVCADCGRQHMRNNPPCSRCGSHDLVQTEQDDDDLTADLEVPSWLEVAKPYAPIVLGFALLVALFVTGIIPTSIIPGIGAPAPPDASGEGDEAAGIDLEAAERAIHDRLEADREAARSYDDDLAAYAEYYNRALVASEYDDANPSGATPDEFGVDCEVSEGRLSAEMAMDSYDDEDALAADIADALESTDAMTTTEFDAEGVDLHYVEGTLYVLYAAC